MPTQTTSLDLAVPSAMERSCQRQTQVLDFPIRCMISTVPTRSADRSKIRARQTCFYGAFRSPTIALS